jgi:hypothetical protein
MPANRGRRNLTQTLRKEKPAQQASITAGASLLARM